jgi:Tol biopolymer transport system component
VLYNVLAGDVSAIWHMAADGGNPRKIVEGGATQPICAPDSRWMAYQVSTQDTYDLMSVGFDGGPQARLVTNVSQTPVSISPDGSRIVARVWAEDGAGLVTRIFAADTGALIATVPSPRNLAALGWSPDGRAVRYVVPEGQGSVAVDQPIAGGAMQQVRRIAAQRFNNLAWSRDGKQLAVTRNTLRTDVVLLRNFN